jgi:hypothetical protein
MLMDSQAFFIMMENACEFSSKEISTLRLTGWEINGKNAYEPYDFLHFK